MAIRSTPTFLQAGSHSAENTRLMLGGMVGAATGSFAGGVAASDPAHGVIRTTDFAVTQNGTPNMTVNVAAGGAFIRGTQSSNQGAYHVWNDATTNLNVAGSDATNPRRDLVIAYVQDSAYSGAVNSATLTIVTGTAAASPVDPSLTAYPNAVVLARIAVGAGVSSILTANITDLRTQSNVLYKVAPFTSTTARSQFIPTPYDGQGAYLNDNTSAEGVYWWNGSSWTRPWNMSWGVVGRALITGQTATSGTSLVTGSSVTFSQVQNRVYKYTVTGHALWASVNDGFRCSLTDGAANALVHSDHLPSGASTTNAYSFSFSWYEIANSSASVTRELRVSRFYGTSGNVTFFADATRIGSLIIEDIGPSGAPS